MPPALRRLCALLIAVAAYFVASPASAGPRWRMLQGDEDEVAFTPLNLTAGAGTSFDHTASSWGPTAGVELFSGSYQRLAWTAAEMKLLFHRPCSSCGISGDMFVGSRAGVVLAHDRRRIHLVTMSAGAGWGSVAADWGNRSRFGHGFIVSPRVRYTAFGLIGVEVQALLPAYDVRGTYPAAVMFNVVGLPLLLFALK